MKIGLDISAVTTGKATGIETYTRAFLKTLSQLESRGHTYYIFTTKNNSELLTGLPDFIRPMWLPGSNEHRWLRVTMQQVLLPRIARQANLDIVNFQSNLASLLLPCVSVLHIKTLHHFQESQSIPWNQRLVRRLLYKPSAIRANIIIANTENTKRDICKYLRITDDRVVIIPEGVDTDIFRPLKKIETAKMTKTLRNYSVKNPYVLFVSTLFPYKNASTLIRAFAKMVSNKSLNRYILVVVGADSNGHLKELQNLASCLGIEERVNFVGHISDRSTIRYFYAGADLFAYPSRYETFGLTVLEAMACGTPVVASNATSLPEVVGDAGILVDPLNVEAMANALTDVLTKRVLRQEMCERGLNRTKQFSWQETVRKTIDVYEQAVKLEN